jgi:hypothetical protein
MNTKRTSCVRLEPEVYEALKRLADAEHRSIEGQIRLLVHQHLKQNGVMPTEEK